MNGSEPTLWTAVVLLSAGTAVAQASPGNQLVPHTGADLSIRQAARDHRSVTLSGEVLDPHEIQEAVPEFHTVERGDTLWDITARYFSNPWQWPSLWALNPQVSNPHWIFPGDRVHLLSASHTATAPVARTASLNALPAPTGQDSTSAPVTATVYLQDQGWLDPREAESAGSLVGSPEDQMLLADGDVAYVEFPRRTPRVGETFTIYQDGQAARGGDRNGGHVVRILGTAVVEAWNPSRHLATVRITESLDSIERGERVAAIPLRMQVIPPVTNDVDLRAHIVATVQPRELVGQHMVVFLDRGTEDRVHKGNRLFVLRRGDAWRDSLTVDSNEQIGTGIDRDGDGQVDSPPGHQAPDRSLPEEVVGEVIVIDARPRSATALVTSNIVEVEIGDIVEMRRGY